MRETIEELQKYIDQICVKGRDDKEIATLYFCIASLYDALEAIKSVEMKESDFDLDEEQVEE